MFSPEGPHVVVVVDWEMCTIGDPLLDLGWLLAVWPDSDERESRFGGALTRAGNLPSSAELFSRYADHSRRDLSAMNWFTVLACFKLGVLQCTYARSMAGRAPRDTGARLHRSAITPFERAARLIAS